MHTTAVLAQSAPTELTVELRSYALLACIGIAGMLVLVMALAIAVGSGRDGKSPKKTVTALTIAGLIALIVPLVYTGTIMRENDETLKIAVARAWPTMGLPQDLSSNGDHAVSLSDHPGTACVLTVHDSDQMFSWTGSVRCGTHPVAPGVRP